MPDNDLFALFEQFGQYSEQANVILTDTAKRRIFNGELGLQGPVEIDGIDVWAAPFQALKIQVLDIDGTGEDRILNFRISFADGDGTALAYLDQEVQYKNTLTILSSPKVGISGWFTVKHD